MKNVLDEITRLRLERNWNEYELSTHCKISQSTISTWYRKNQTPTIKTIEKVCKGFGITLSQFFAEGNDPVSLTPEQKEMLDNWSSLNPTQQQIIKALLQNM
ncbi:helix-turn-helix domain-containing protein [Allofournierella sp.]|uniref:helix-turn-helix domain-containing protein n=1 Tax=Allofournierella sp. TaxID=1940256 RepID=UPI003AB14044